MVQLCTLLSLQIIVPMPSFDSQTKKPWAKTPKEKEKVSEHFISVIRYDTIRDAILTCA